MYFEVRVPSSRRTPLFNKPKLSSVYFYSKVLSSSAILILSTDQKYSSTVWLTTVSNDYAWTVETPQKPFLENISFCAEPLKFLFDTCYNTTFLANAKQFLL